jgi:wyosine [tRNA(Phe)-imidazoG37] synthetase (radical SAM superfamily)
MNRLLHFIIFYVLPRPLARGLTNALIFSGMILRRQLVGPRNVQISIPSGCDHNCQFCITDIHGAGAPKNRKTLSFEEICTAIDSVLSVCSLNIHLVSQGEPALYPKIRELIEFIHRKSRGRALIKIVTNGTSLHRFDPDFVKKNNLYFWISLHSGDFETWKKTHRPLAKDEEKFFSLRAWLIQLNKEVRGRVTLHNVISILNKDSLESILDFAQETGSKDVFFGRLYQFPDLQLSAGQEREVVKSLEALAPRFKTLGIRNNIAGFKFVALSQDENKEEKSLAPLEEKKILKSQDFYRHHNCFISWLYSPINDTGQVSSCGGGRIYGSLRESSYASLLREKAPDFLAEATQIRETGLTVKGCRCLACPHIQMNAQAHYFLNKIGRD